MKGRIFLTRDNTYCSIFSFTCEPITIIGEIHEEITNEGLARTPVVPAFRGEPIVCPYCFCNHDIPDGDGYVFPNCEYKKVQAIVKDETGYRYSPDKDGFYVKYR